LKRPDPPACTTVGRGAAPWQSRCYLRCQRLRKAAIAAPRIEATLSTRCESADHGSSSFRKTRNGTPEFAARFSVMSSDRVIIDAIKMAQRLLWQNRPATHNLPDAATVIRFRDLVRSPAVQSALERSSDTFPAFTLRAVERVLADQSRTDREIISRLWDVLDDPHLNLALGLLCVPKTSSA
jgi:hypothetical protein